MDYTVFQVPGRLADWVRSVWYLEGEAGALDAPVEILPDGCAEIVLNVGAPMRELQRDGVTSVQSSTMLVGQMTSVTCLVPNGHVACWGVKLHPWAVGAFAAAPGSLFNNTKHSLDTALPALSDWAGRIADACSASEQYAVLITCLEGYTSRLRPPDPVVAAAVWMLADGTTIAGVRDVARILNTSERSLELRFAQHAGLSPKRYQRIRRFQRVLRIATTMERVNWGIAAARAGYYDQAHLIRDTRDIAGRAPSRLFQSTSQVTELFLSDS